MSYSPLLWETPPFEAVVIPVRAQDASSLGILHVDLHGIEFSVGGKGFVLVSFKGSAIGKKVNLYRYRLCHYYFW